MDRWTGKVAVVTGASSGIGAAITEKLVENGVHVAGFARRVEKVEELAKKLCAKRGKLCAFKCDVSKQDDVTKAFDLVKKKMGPVHILVNNAGLFKYGSIVEGNSEDWKIVMDTNVLGLTMCSQQAIKQMREKNIAGHIIHINSVAGRTAVAGSPPILNLYSPSKYAVTCVGEILRQEFNHFKANIKTTSINPGLVETEIFEAAGQKFDLSKLNCLKPLDIANAVIYALGTPPYAEVQELTIAPLGAQSI